MLPWRTGLRGRGRGGEIEGAIWVERIESINTTFLLSGNLLAALFRFKIHNIFALTYIIHLFSSYYKTCFLIVDLKIDSSGWYAS